MRLKTEHATIYTAPTSDRHLRRDLKHDDIPGPVMREIFEKESTLFVLSF